MELITSVVIPLLTVVMIIATTHKTTVETRLLKMKEATERTSTETSAINSNRNSIIRTRRLGRALGLFGMFMAVSYLGFLTFTPAGEAPLTLGNMASLFQSLILAFSAFLVLRDG